jgi:hypothetical protein
MIYRIYNKFIQILDKGIISIYNTFERIGIAKPIPFKTLEPKNDIIQVEHPFPVNIIEKDKPLFNEWRSYPTFENKLFILENCNVSCMGIVFIGARCFVPALPHPVFKGQFGTLYCLKNYLFYKEQQLSTDKTYFLVTDHWAYSNYFHWMVDSMCRLMQWKEMLKDVTVLVHEGAPRFIIESLNYLNVSKIEIIQKNHYLNVPNLVVPNYCAWSGQQHPIILKVARQFILHNVRNEKKFERVFISRRNAKARRVANEDDLIPILKENKFEIINFEGMSVAEQVAIVRNVKHFVSSHGANMTNSMFLEPDSKILELIRYDRPNFCYWSTLASVGNKNYFYQLCKVVDHDHLLVDISQFKIHLHKILND